MLTSQLFVNIKYGNWHQTIQIQNKLKWQELFLQNAWINELFTKQTVSEICTYVNIRITVVLTFSDTDRKQIKCWWAIATYKVILYFELLHLFRWLITSLSVLSKYAIQLRCVLQKLLVSVLWFPVSILPKIAGHFGILYNPVFCPVSCTFMNRSTDL